MGAEQNFDWAAHAASTLAWWREAGLDTSIDETPRNWLRPVAAATPVPAPVGAVAGNRTAPFAALPEVAAPSPLPGTLAAFDAWRVGPDAPEAAWSGPALGAQGPADTELMILIDQPEREDADSGILLSGAAGRLFDRMLAAIGRDRSSIYLAAVATKRPVSGRIAPEEEIRLNEIARHHVALANPKALLLLGNAPSRAVLGADAARMRGGLHQVNPGNGNMPATQTQAIASFHPRFLLERPAAKAEAWKDLQMLIGGLSR